MSIDFPKTRYHGQVLKLTITPALACAPTSQASKTENRRDVAIPPKSLPIMRISKLLKSITEHEEVVSVIGYELNNSFTGIHFMFTKALTLGQAAQRVNDREHDHHLPSSHLIGHAADEATKDHRAAESRDEEDGNVVLGVPVCVVERVYLM